MIQRAIPDEYDTQPDELPGESSSRRSRLLRDIREHVALAIRQEKTDALTDDERRWVRLAIEREAQSIAFRRAVINKTLTSLVWVGIVGLGYVLLDYLKTHFGFKP